MRFTAFLLLIACTDAVMDKGISPDDTGDSAATMDDTASDTTDTSPHLVDVSTAETVAVLPWAEDETSERGLRGVGTDNGFWVMDIIGGTYDPDPTERDFSYTYQIPWSATEAETIEAAAAIYVTGTINSTDMIETNGGEMSLSERSYNPDDGDYERHVYRLPEPTTSGNLSDLSVLDIGGFEDTSDIYYSFYTATSMWLDYDGDDKADDLAVAGETSGYSYEEYTGAIGIFRNAPESGSLVWDDRTSEVDLCLRDNSQIGPRAMTLDADGSLWATCLSSSSSDRGSAYVFPIPLTPSTAIRFDDVHGTSVIADPRGGAWLSSEDTGELVYAQADGTTQRFSMEDVPYFGSSPVIVQVGDQILIVVGALGVRDVVDSSVYLCDITDLSAWSCTAYPAEGAVGCVGGVNAVSEQPDGLYFASSGFYYGGYDGCGVQMWKVAL